MLLHDMVFSRYNVKLSCYFLIRNDHVILRYESIILRYATITLFWDMQLSRYFMLSIYHVISWYFNVITWKHQYGFDAASQASLLARFPFASCHGGISSTSVGWKCGFYTLEISSRSGCSRGLSPSNGARSCKCILLLTCSNYSLLLGYNCWTWLLGAVASEAVLAVRSPA